MILKIFNSSEKIFSDFPPVGQLVLEQRYHNSFWLRNSELDPINCSTHNNLHNHIIKLQETNFCSSTTSPLTCRSILTYYSGLNTRPMKAFLLTRQLLIITRSQMMISTTVHEMQDEAQLQGSERLGGSIMTDVLVKYMIWTEQVDNTACSVRVYCKDNQLRKVYGCVILYISRDIQKYTNPRS